MHDFYNNKTTLITISNKENGLSLKNLYLKMNKLDNKNTIIRLIYGGFEIKDDLLLNKIKFNEISMVSVIVRNNSVQSEEKEPYQIIAKKSSEIKIENEQIKEGYQALDNINIETSIDKFGDGDNNTFKCDESKKNG